MGDRRDPTIQSVDRAARILKALAAGSPRLGVSELAERLGLAKTTVHGLLRTLERQDLVEQDPETGKYRLGPEMLQVPGSDGDKLQNGYWSATTCGAASNR